MAKKPGKKPAKKYHSLYLNHRVMWLLSLDMTSSDVQFALTMLGNLLTAASRRMETILTPADWLYLANVMGGLDEYVRDPLISLASMVRAEVECEARHPGVAAEVWPADPAGNLAELKSKVSDVCEVEAYAILATVRHLGRLPDEMASEDWYKLPHRVTPSVQRRIAAARAGG